MTCQDTDRYAIMAERASDMLQKVSQGDLIYRSYVQGTKKYEKSVIGDDVAMPGATVSGTWAENYGLAFGDHLMVTCPDLGIELSPKGKVVIDDIERTIVKLIRTPSVGQVIVWHIFVSK